ncbi:MULTISPECIES: ArsR/SmtB family transcription factor [Streptomyces]|uniref:ArsR family transcriptional regulator n=2 Tax=Streptomyces TaxID=1883 RepID=A0A100Y8N7_9ACTN|nr:MULTISPECIES: winged helix-turn-helix domain-containing protein [Streptomyces]KUH39735.1 ArsR family transcriptional regulator [Streptomyces kanasensis]UUS34563.1 helix-turn-helix domain-containing protein [Streptomyces changanensis]
MTSFDGTYADGPDLAEFAGLLADRTRAAFCLALLDGRAWTASELARTAGVARSTASAHLDRLVRGGILAEERQGRNRLLRLATADTAEMIENLAARARSRPAPVRSLTDANRRRALAQARVCYDHLGGAPAVAITDATTERGLLAWDYGPALTTAGRDWLRDLGIADDGPNASWRPHVRTCLDWTEQRPHLAGAVGAALFRHALESSWLVRRSTTRMVTVTDAGHTALRTRLRLTDDALVRPAAPAGTSTGSGAPGGGGGVST